MATLRFWSSLILAALIVNAGCADHGVERAPSSLVPAPTVDGLSPPSGGSDMDAPGLPDGSKMLLRHKRNKKTFS